MAGRPLPRGIWVLYLVLLAMLARPLAAQPEGTAAEPEAEQPVAASATAAGEAAGPCSGKKPGHKLKDRFLVVFDEGKVDSLESGVESLLPALSQPGQAAAAASGVEALPFEVVGGIGGDVSTLTGTGPGRRLLSASERARRPRPRRNKAVIGLMVKVARGAAGKAVVGRMRSVDTVKFVDNDYCVGLADTAAAAASASPPPPPQYTCLPAPKLSGLPAAPVDAASGYWTAACWNPSAYKYAWWGERCGAASDQVQWNGVFAYSKTTGEVVSNCVRTRPAGASLSTDLRFWLGDCGVTPEAIPGTPGRVCSDPFVAATTDEDAAASPSGQACVAYGAPVTHTVPMPHPRDGCGGRDMVRMTYTGELCAPTPSYPGGIRWLRADPEPGQAGVDQTACALTRVSNPTSSATQLFNKDWFGACGVPPARVQYLARGSCPAPPPPPSPPPPSPPPPPPPRPRIQLPREPVVTLNQTIPPGMKRLMAVRQSNTTGQMETVTVDPAYRYAAAVLDTGVDCTHPDLNIKLSKAFFEERAPFGIINTACYDGYGHGTHVSGIIGAKNNGLGVIGVMPDTPIVNLKVLGRDGSGQLGNVIAALDWLLEISPDGEQINPGGVTNAQALRVAVVSMSIGASTSTIDSGNPKLLCDLLSDLEQIGVVSVSAAGNSAQPLNNWVPSMCPAAVAVTSIDQGDGTINPSQSFSYFTNYLWLNDRIAGVPPWTEDKRTRTIAGPGSRINSTCSPFSIYASNNVSNAYCQLTGTSQATPHVAGIYVRCFCAGACRESLGNMNAYVVLDEFTYYNKDHPEFGFQQDPGRMVANESNPDTLRYYGWLAWADAY